MARGRVCDADVTALSPALHSAVETYVTCDLDVRCVSTDWLISSRVNGIVECQCCSARCLGLIHIRLYSVIGSLVEVAARHVLTHVNNTTSICHTDKQHMQLKC